MGPQNSKPAKKEGPMVGCLASNLVHHFSHQIYSRHQYKVYVPSSLNNRLTERMFPFRFNYNGVRTKTERKRNGKETEWNENEMLTNR